MKKGFTLIELLVVIAVLGILASVVLVAINPSERIKEANDSGVKNDVSQVASALESYFTNQKGLYDGATSGDAGTLVVQGYLKRWPTSTSINIVTGTSGSAVAYGTLTAASATCATGASATKYWVWRSSTGASRVECLASVPTAP